MAYFARKLRYGAHDGEAGAQFMALIEIAKKKWGRPIEFVLYQRIMQYYYPSENITRMIRFTAATAEEAIKRFWPWSEGTGKEFPGWKSERWEKTTLWLYSVAVGGSYEKVRHGDWVRVGRPSLWSKRRKKKKPLRFGHPAHIILVDQARIRSIEEEIDGLKYKLNELESYDDDNDFKYVPEENLAEHDRIEEKVTKLMQEIFSIKAKAQALREEMRAEAYRMFPIPLGMIPKRDSRPKPERRM